MSWRNLLGCDFGLQSWGKWTDGEVYKSQRKNSDAGAGIIDGVPYWIDCSDIQVQTRTCSACGLKRSRSFEI
jgi:hypothetical protein